MKAITVILLAALCGFFGFSIWSSQGDAPAQPFLINSSFVESSNEIITWKPVESQMSLNEIPHWTGFSSSNGANDILEELNKSFSSVGLSRNTTIRVYLNGESSVYHISGENSELEELAKALFGKEAVSSGEKLTSSKFLALLFQNNIVISNSESALSGFTTEKKDEAADVALNDTKLSWFSRANAKNWFEREEVSVEGAGVVEFKKRNGFVYGYSFLPDSNFKSEPLGVTYSIWDFQLPGDADGFTIEEFPIRELDSETISGAEEICECDVKSAWKSWNTQQVYLFDQNGIEFFGIQCLEDLTASSGMYPFISDDSEMYKGYQIQSLISGAEVGGLYADMFGREVSHYLDLEEQVFFFSSRNEAKSFVGALQSSRFSYLVDDKLKELLLLSPDYTEYEASAVGENPVVYQYEKQDNGRYFHALWKGGETDVMVAANQENEPVLTSGVSSEKWEIQLDGKLARAPFIFNNHYTKENEVMVITENNELLLLNSKGKKLWSRKLTEGILGELHQVDLFRNNKFQLVFSSESQLYAIDRNGKDVENFPVKFKSKASAPVSVMDYDGKRKYRLLVPLADGSLLNYDADGKEVRGWKHKTEDSPIVSQVHHTIIGRKDYLVSAKENGKIAIYKRDGKLRYTQDLKLSNYSGSAITLVSSSNIENVKLVYVDDSGNLVHTTLSLDNEEATNLGLASADYSIIQNVVGGKAPDYLLAKQERLALYSDEYELKFSADFENKIHPEIQVFKIGEKQFVGIVEGSNVHLLDLKGESLSGFPVYGQSPGALLDMDNDGTLELVTSDNEGLVICYEAGL